MQSSKTKRRKEGSSLANVVILLSILAGVLLLCNIAQFKRVRRLNKALRRRIEVDRVSRTEIDRGP